jgi:hypothetical protein
VAWKPEGEDRKYVELILAMSTDALLGKGVDSRETFLGNLEKAIEGMRGSEKKDDTKNSSGLGPGAWIGP